MHLAAVSPQNKCYLANWDLGGVFSVCTCDNNMSFFPIKHALSGKAHILPFDPAVTCNQECIITTFQDVYFVSESFEDAKNKMRSVEFSSLNADQFFNLSIFPCHFFRLQLIKPTYLSSSPALTCQLANRSIATTRASRGRGLAYGYSCHHTSTSPDEI